MSGTDKKAARDAKQAAMFAKLAVAETENWRRRISKTDPFNASNDKQKAFYRLILGIRWLPPEIWDVTLVKGLGVSVRAHKARWLQGWARETQYRIDERVRRMEEKNEAGPKGGRIGKAEKDEADSQGLEVSTMRRRLERLGPNGPKAERRKK
jgi:hypothetical protein